MPSSGSMRRLLQGTMLAAGLSAGLIAGCGSASAAPGDDADAGAGPAAARQAQAQRPAARVHGAARAVPAIAVPKATTAAPRPFKAAVAAAKAYIYGYPLLEYERVRATAENLNAIYSLTSFANPGDRRR